MLDHHCDNDNNDDSRNRDNNIRMYLVVMPALEEVTEEMRSALVTW